MICYILPEKLKTDQVNNDLHIFYRYAYEKEREIQQKSKMHFCVAYVAKSFRDTIKKRAQILTNVQSFVS